MPGTNGANRVNEEITLGGIYAMRQLLIWLRDACFALAAYLNEIGVWFGMKALLVNEDDER